MPIRNILLHCVQRQNSAISNRIHVSELSAFLIENAIVITTENNCDKPNVENSDADDCVLHL